MKITMIQFHTIEHKNGYDHAVEGHSYYVRNDSFNQDYWMGEDDDGDDQYDNFESFELCDSIEDMINERYLWYVAKEGATYSTITIEVPVDEDGNPILKTA